MSVLSQYIERLGNQALDAAMRARVEEGRRLETELAEAKGGPVLALLAKSRLEAIATVEALIYADATDVSAVMQLQNQILRHFDLLKWAGEITSEANEYWVQLDAQAQEDIAEMIDPRQDGD